jgi:hypothetical protein
MRKTVEVRIVQFEGSRCSERIRALLEAVTRRRLVKTQQAGKDLACAVVIFEVWKSARLL